MKYGKMIGRVALGALALSVIPYQFKKDEETGAVEIRSLLWGWKKTPPAEGETKARITFSIPGNYLNESPAEAAPAEEPAEAPAEAPTAEEPAAEAPTAE